MIANNTVEKSKCCLHSNHFLILYEMKLLIFITLVNVFVSCSLVLNKNQKNINYLFSIKYVHR